MNNPSKTPGVVKALAFVCLLGAFCALACTSEPQTGPGESVRFAQFNIWELSREKLDQVNAAGEGTSPQLRKAAEIIQRVRPDVLLINEIDFDADERLNLQRFQERYLGVSQRGQEPLPAYPYTFFEAVNTGVPSGLDLNHDGATDSPEDGFGYGRYPGQYGMALLSRFPIDEQQARTFQKLLWRQMPGHLIPDGQAGKPAWYSPGQVEILRLSSKSHWDVPVRIGSTTVHVLGSHPTPMSFDGDEDRNGRRNFDESRLWADYIAGGERAEYIVDDTGTAGALSTDSLFVVMGDMNNDPQRDPGPYGMAAMSQILRLERVQDPLATNEFRSIDYVLPSTGLKVVGQGIFWPEAGDPLRVLVDEPEPASDHKMNWVDLHIP